jgi:ABC-2 type transport system ATP-binding protein
MTAASHAIQTNGLTKYYGDIVGIEDVSLDVYQGEVFGFLGANGAGKTTTIRVLLDLVRPSAGAASILGFDCHRQSRDARARIGYLPGELPIYPEMTGGSFLKFLTNVDSRAVSPARLEMLLRRFDVSDIDLRRKLRDYSQGMKRKLGVIQAMMTGAPVIILDEPTLGLDPLMIDAFCETVREIQRDGATVFLSSHVLAEVERVCDRIGLIRRGRLVDVQSLADLRRHAARRVIIDFSQPLNGTQAATLPIGDGVVMITCEPTRWVLEVQGPLGPTVARLGTLPIADLQIESFTLQDYVLERYGDPSS